MSPANLFPVSLRCISTAAMAALLVAVPVSAQETDPGAAPNDDPSRGAYLNGAVTRISNEQFDLDAFTARAGWNFAKNFGVEGEISLPTGEDNQQFVVFELDRVIAIFATARINPSERFELFARAGLIDSKVDVRIPAQNDSFEVDQRSAAIGAGAKLFVTKRLGIRAGYTYAEAESFDVGVEYRF